MSRVLLAGAFGQANPGDEALLEAFMTRLGNWRVVATSSSPDETARRHGCDVVASWDVPRLARVAAASEGVVFAGGTVFKALHDSTGRAPLDLLRRGLMLAAGSKAIGKPVALLGVGAAPLRAPAARMMTRSLVRRSDLLVLRDEESARLLLEAGVPRPLRVGADPAWTLFAGSRSAPAQPARDGSAVIVALSHLAGRHDLSIRLEHLLRPVVSEADVLLQPWQSSPVHHADTVLATDLAARLGGVEVLPPPADLNEAVETFAGAGLVVGLRFHALVAAAAAGTRFVAYGHEPKLAALARKLAQPLVRPEQTIEDPAGAARIIVGALDGAPPAPGAVAAEIAAAEQQFRMLRVLLSRGRCDESDDAGGLPLVPAPWEDE